MTPKGRKTFQWDLVRGVCDGTGNTIHSTFALLVAIEFFHSPDALKALIASGPSIGMGISFLYATYSHCLIGKRNVEAAIPVFLSSICLVAGSFSGNGTTFAILAFLAQLFFMSRFPLMTAIYRENYLRENRGQAFGFSVLVASVGSILMVRLGGLYLDGGMERFRILFLAIAAFVFCGALAILQIPSEKTERKPFPNPFSYFSILVKDRAFCYVLTVWFVFGFANLMMIPQRIEYITQDRYGLALSPGMVALIATAIPELVKVLLVIPMGWLFDRMNFIVLRILINVFFASYMLVYFHATSIPMLLFGSVLLGVSFAGGVISWNLWVTKFAIPSETAKYMAMHTFFNGVRGVLAPLAGYLIASTDSVSTAGNYAAALMFLSCLMLAPLIPKGAPFDRQNRESQAAQE